MFFGKDKKGGEKPQVFFDKQGTPKIQLPQGFVDQEGSVTMQQAVEIASGIPEAIKTMPLDQLQQYMETLKEIYEAAKKNDPNAAQDEGNMDEEEEKYDDEGNPINDKAKSKAYDALKDKKARGGYTDAQVEKMVNDKVAQATKQAVQDHAKAIEKARHFLDDNYDFTTRDTKQIMRDAIATQTSESYTDQELPLAFKMLQIPERSEVVNFGDRSPELGEEFQKLADKDL